MIIHKEMAERDSELLYRVIFENTLDGLEVIDAETGRVVLANQSMAKIFGFTFPKEMVGLNPLDYILTEDRDRVARLMAEEVFQRNLRRVIELRAITRDGREIWISALGVRIEYQGRLAGLISVRDITSQKLAETRLQVSEEERHLLMQNADEAIVVVQDGVLKFADPKAMEFTGYSEKDLNTKPFMEFIHPDDRQMVAELYLKKLKGNETPHGSTFRAIGKEGNVIWCGLKVVSFTWEGKPAVWCFMKDITKHKKAEEAFLEGEKKYRSIAENITDVIWVTDSNARPTYVSPSVTRFAGFTIEEALAGSIQKSLAPASVKLAAENLAKALASGNTAEQDAIASQPLELEIKHKNGSTIWASTRFSFIRDSDGRPVEMIGVLHDITEHKRAEKELQHKEQYFRALIENSSDAIIVVNRDGTNRYVSPSTGRMLGYKPDERIGVSIFESVHPDDIQPAADDLARLLQNPGATMQTEVRVQHKDGNWHTIESTATNLLHNPAIEGIVVNLRDITERKKAEEELRESERKFRAIFDNANDGFISVDPESRRFFNANRRMIQMLGYESEEEIRNLTVSDIHPEKDLPYILGEFEKHARGEISRSEGMPVKRKDGSIFLASISSYPVTIANKTYLSCVFIDITERKRAEESLQESERRNRLLAGSASDVIWVTDMNLRPTYVSPSVTSLLGYSVDEAMAGGLGQGLIPAPLKGVSADLTRALAEKGEPNKATELPPQEIEVKRKDGSTAWAEVRSILIRGPDRQPVEILGVLHDITKRKQAEEATKESEARYRLLAENVSDIIWVTDMNLRPTYLSPSFTRLMGYSLEESMVRSIGESLTPSSLKAAADAFIKAMAAEQQGQKDEVLRMPPLELEMIRKDGSTVWVASTVSFIRGPDGQPVEMMGIVRDITERKRAEEALRGSEERFRNLVETTSDWVWEMDTNGTCTYVSPKVRDILGYEPEDLIGKVPFNFIPTDDVGRIIEVFTSILASQKPFALIEINSLHKDGHTVVLETSGVPFFDARGALLGYRAVSRDVTERKVAEEALRGSEERFRGLVETTSDFVWELDENSVYTYVSPKIHEILGYEAGELLGKHPYDFGPDNGTGHETSEVIVAAMTQHRPFRFVETIRLHRDGHHVVMETSGVPFFDWNGILRGYRGIDRDITERQEARKKLEQSLRKLEKTMDGTIQAITLTVESRDRFTAGHQKRVAQLACAIAQEMGFDSEQIQVIRIAGLLHDIGKISVPQEILTKPGSLTDIEFQLIKAHSQTGYDILKTVEFPWPIADIVIQHHERMNGSGYPSGIREDKLLIEARILGVADVVEAMSSHRPYRVAPGVEKALEEISRNSGILYDPNVVHACLRVFTEKGFKFE